MSFSGIGRFHTGAREELREALRREHHGAAQAHRLRVLLPDEERMPEGLTLIEQEEWKQRHGEAS